jgi:hypothetical protein
MRFCFRWTACGSAATEIEAIRLWSNDVRNPDAIGLLCCGKKSSHCKKGKPMKLFLLFGLQCQTYNFLGGGGGSPYVVIFARYGDGPDLETCFSFLLSCVYVRPRTVIIVNFLVLLVFPVSRVLMVRRAWFRFPPEEGLSSLWGLAVSMLELEADVSSFMKAHVVICHTCSILSDLCLTAF